MVAYAQKIFPDVKISMISNGSLLKSADDEHFRQIRGGKLEKVRRGISDLLDARNARGLAEPVIGLAVTVLRSTVPALVQPIITFYRAMRLDAGVVLQTL